MNETGTRTTRGQRGRRPEIDTVFTINDDGSRNFIQTADVHGRWHMRKAWAHWFLLAIFLVLPWIRIGGNPSLYFDLPGRQAFMFGQSFTNQDFYLVFFMVSGLGFALFVATSLWGRIWCGYACPHTVFLEGIYRRLERWIEGSREKRVRRNTGPWTFDRIWRKSLKQTLYVVVALVLAHTFLLYFVPSHKLLGVIQDGPGAHWVTFAWTMFWTGAIYFDNAWFREQLCLIVCPYGRIQSALTDADTVIIGYDETRGEPRSKKTAGGGGDCVDCGRCVAVCPTGIDIRNGLQLECIGCANCIDACDEVMTKLHRPAGLIRYDSQRGFDGGRRRSMVRPRVFLYAFLALLGLGVFAATALQRSPFEVRMLRPRGLPYTLQESTIQNLYTLHLQNKSNRETTLALAVEPVDPAHEVAFIIPQTEVTIPALGDREVPIFATVDRGDYSGGFPLRFTVSDPSTGREKTLEFKFRGP